ncbi:MAG: hypothetical protein Q8S73_33190 [Deltaproteobacteria bacterium]|nr:hypothetical protein [Deltaproteobacteria bacterium]
MSHVYQGRIPTCGMAGILMAAWGFNCIKDESQKDALDWGWRLAERRLRLEPLPVPSVPPGRTPFDEWPYLRQAGYFERMKLVRPVARQGISLADIEFIGREIGLKVSPFSLDVHAASPDNIFDRMNGKRAEGSKLLALVTVPDPRVGGIGAPHCLYFRRWGKDDRTVRFKDSAIRGDEEGSLSGDDFIKQWYLRTSDGSQVRFLGVELRKQ